MQGLSSNRTGTYRYITLAGLFALCASARAHAQSAACSATDTSLSCRLTGVLHWLEAAAFVLAIVLLAVIGIAIHLVRKNRLNRKAGR